MSATAEALTQVRTEAVQPVTRLSDDLVRRIFERQLTREDLGYTRQQQFLRHLARALADAEAADFAILRPMLVLLIARYRLAAPLEAA